MDHKKRAERITSSQAYKLIKTGRAKTAIWSAPALTYFEEKQIERRMGLSLDSGEPHSDALAWGNFMEYAAYKLIGLNDMSYLICSNETLLHPKYSDIWSGTPDLIVRDVLIAEIKCYGKKKFALYTDAITKKVDENFTIEDKIKSIREGFPEEYWQMVSNAHICNVKLAEAVTYMPYASEMKDLREIADDPAAFGPENQWRYRFIVDRPNEQLDVLPDGGYYKNLNVFRFEIPQEDLDYLEARIVLAGPIIKNYKL